MSVQKGQVLSLVGPEDRNGDLTRARVAPLSQPGLVSRPLTIPWFLRGKMGGLEKGTRVAFTVFEDCSGIILARMDGDWEGIIPGPIQIGAITADGTLNVAGSISTEDALSVAGDVTTDGKITASGDVEASDFSASTLPGVVFSTHKHTNAAGPTGVPQP